MNKTIDRCPHCGASALEVLVEIEKYSYLIRPTEFESIWRTVPMTVGLCHGCGTAMQLLPPDREALDEIYSKYYGSYPTFASDPEMDERHREFLEFLVAGGLPMSGHALEIGSYDGRFLARLQSAGMTVQGCDPNAAAAAEAERAFGVETTLEYFTPDTFPADSFDFVSARLVLEHVTEPDSFLGGLQKVVRTNGHVALEVPDCGIVMAEGAPFWMYEHPNYFTATSLLRAMRRHGFDGTVTSHKGILRAVCRNTGEASLPTDDVAVDVALAHEFRRKYRDYVARYDAVLAEVRRQGLPMAVYGIGNYFTNLLSSTSLDHSEIVAIYDGNPKKWGLEIEGLGLPIQSPDGVNDGGPGVVLLASASYQGMLDRIAPYMDRGGKALLPLPTPVLYQRSAAAGG
ncbi:class I SAM-dependent methyltransferase [Inquilinus sp. CA228]|uniref:class I SAM-dependent methyltransferase n=1 Tax=Inquilinus sp. CA228 TaxID=3455609 RepID=UPI003F8D2BF6